MPWVVKTQRGYIKHTSHFGLFHGSVVLTDCEAEAFRFTRKSDAERRAATLITRCARPGHRDNERFGELTATVE